MNGEQRGIRSFWSAQLPDSVAPHPVDANTSSHTALIHHPQPPSSRVSITTRPDGVITHLGETDVLGLLTEALTADVESVLADKTGLVGADTARREVC